MIVPTLAALVAAALAAPPSPQEKALVAELARACRIPASGLSDFELVHYAGALAGERTAALSCPRRDNGLALRLAKMVAETPGPESGAAYLLLASLHERGRGVKKDAAMARSYRQRAWLLESPWSAPFTTAAQSRAYLTAPETIAFLRGRIARGAPPKERVRLAEALLTRRAAGDVADARILLKTPDPATEAKARLLLAQTAVEPDATPADVAEAAARLRPAAPGPSANAEVRELLLRLGQLQLAKARTAEEKWDSIATLAAAAYAGEEEPLQAFRRTLLAANGGLEPATVEAEVPPPAIRGDDYPASALRNDISGNVHLRALVDPLGRIVFTEGVDPAEPAILVDAVRRAYALRRAPAVEIAAPRPTPYVWVTLRPVAFRLSS